LYYYLNSIQEKS